MEELINDTDTGNSHETTSGRKFLHTDPLINLRKAQKIGSCYVYGTLNDELFHLDLNHTLNKSQIEELKKKINF